MQIHQWGTLHRFDDEKVKLGSLVIFAMKAEQKNQLLENHIGLVAQLDLSDDRKNRGILKFPRLMSSIPAKRPQFVDSEMVQDSDVYLLSDAHIELSSEIGAIHFDRNLQLIEPGIIIIHKDRPILAFKHGNAAINLDIKTGKIFNQPSITKPTMWFSQWSIRARLGNATIVELAKYSTTPLFPHSGPKLQRKVPTP